MQEAKELFRKLKITTLLDLALLLPHSYHDTTLSATIDPGRVHTLQAKVTKSLKQNGRLTVQFWLTDFNRTLNAVFFRATPYHYKLFSEGSEVVIQGKIETFQGQLQMGQPKAISQAGRIIPKYKTILKQSEMRALLEAFLSQAALMKAGLRANEAEMVMRLHFPGSLEGILQDGLFHPRIQRVLGLIEAINHLQKLSAKKSLHPPLLALKGEIAPFVEGLPFCLTAQQHEVIDSIRTDLARSDKAAKRMIVGDVGSGKTMVILASVMMALPHKSILMAPTSLLALQLYEEAIKHLPSQIKVALVMQGGEQGCYREADCIIGTHALLYREDLPQAPLVMVDEQHRFGTKQRHQLELLASGRGDQSAKRAHFLQFSATPIPRTQAMMQSALIDVSLITQRPFELKVATKIIIKSDFTRLLAHMREEIAAGHQVLIIYPLVEESETNPYQSLMQGREYWESRFERVFVTHGKDKNKEEVLLAFREQGDILLATTVVEVGISLPRLTLIVIVGAERLGLATLHQLRGRVGRLGLESWCYLFTRNAKNERLQAFTQTTNGFDIARLDLEFREGGDILEGTIQSGQKFRWLDMAQDEDIIAEAQKRV